MFSARRSKLIVVALLVAVAASLLFYFLQKDTAGSPAEIGSQAINDSTAVDDTDAPPQKTDQDMTKRELLEQMHEEQQFQESVSAASDQYQEKIQQLNDRAAAQRERNRELEEVLNRLKQKQQDQAGK